MARRYNSPANSKDFMPNGFESHGMTYGAQSPVLFQSDGEVAKPTTTTTKLEFLNGELEKLCGSSLQTEARLSAMDDKLTRMIESMERIVGREIGGESQSSTVPESSHTPIQVHNSPLEQNRENSWLGYRSGQLNVANRDSMLKKFEMRMFTGRQPYVWLIEFERFFHIGRYSDGEKLALVALYLEGNIRKWFYWESGRKGFKDWSDFKKKLVLIFSESIENLDIANHEMPSFDGTIPYVWLQKLERFFHIYDDKAKLGLASLHLEGVARKWFYRELSKRRFLDWTDFKCRLMARFDPVKNDSPSEVKLKDESVSRREDAQETEFQETESLSQTQIDTVQEAESLSHHEALETGSLMQDYDPNSSGGAVHESVPLISEAIASLGGAVHEPESLNLHVNYEKSSGSVSSLVQTCCLTHPVSASPMERSNPTNYVVVSEIAVEESVKMPQSWTPRLKPTYTFQLFAYKLRRVTNKNMQRKNHKTWRFKFKRGAETKAFHSGFPYVKRMQNSYTLFEGMFFETHILHQRKMSLSPTFWMFNYTPKVLRKGAIQVFEVSSDKVGLMRKRTPLHNFNMLQHLNTSPFRCEMTACHDRAKETSKEWPASENNDATEMFQFLQITKPVTVTLRLAQPISTATQVKDTEICSIQRPSSSVRRWTLQLDTHLWHRWKNKIGILQIVSELVLPKVDLFQVTRWIVLLNASLRSSLFSREGVYKGLSTCILMVDVQIWLLSTASEYDILKRNARKQREKKRLITHLLQILIQQEEKWKSFYKSRMFKYKRMVTGYKSYSAIIGTKRQSSKLSLALKWEGVLNSVSAAIDPAKVFPVACVTILNSRREWQPLEFDLEGYGFGFFIPSLRASLFSLGKVLISFTKIRNRKQSLWLKERVCCY
ncbi:unnamed protein product [Microthlaspi erraticum]|uniref:Retrotransposon gag domain-containing protein n=1 Tax=Microthlaspi erraticum TaxID=1685480 RepID=A0A6D2JFZ8_9BRAS|nr:unnamed protein product [Microthlaspi erraticum]